MGVLAGFSVTSVSTYTRDPQNSGKHSSVMDPPEVPGQNSARFKLKNPDLTILLYACFIDFF
jgi:hypothetical protein